MNEIDPETGLPVLPEGLTWALVKNFPGTKRTDEFQFRSTNGCAILIMSGDQVVVASHIYRANWDNPSRTTEEFLDEGLIYHWLEVTEEDIAYSAQFAMATLSIITKREKNRERAERLFGSFPPNKIERNT